MIDFVKKMLCTILLLTGVTATNFIQAQDADKRVSLDVKDAKLADVINDLRKQTDISFFYNVDELNKLPKVTLQVSNKKLSEVLEQLLKGSTLQYSVENNTVIIKKKPVSTGKQKPTGATVTVTGRVQSENGGPLPGASVEDLSTHVATTTDASGFYSIEVAPRTELLFSYVGKRTFQQAIHAEGKTSIVHNISLEELDTEMSQVVITGYQTIRKSEMVGSANTINRKDMYFDGTNSIEGMLQGKLPGTVVMNNNGMVGTRQKVRVRGTSTLLSSQEPVWVVDGIIQTDPLPFEAQALNDVGDNIDMIRNFVGNGIAWLNPNDIEDVTVLKDAAATVLYGVKAANGVIVINTKKGQQGRMSVSYNGNISITERLTYDKLNLMNSKERIDVSREIYEKGLIGNQETNAVGFEYYLNQFRNKQITYDQFNAGVKELETLNMDWLGLLYRTPVSHNHSLSLSGGSDKLTYYTSLSATQNLGTAIGNESNTYGASVNLNTTLSPKLTAGFRLNANMAQTNGFYKIDPYKYAQETSRAIGAKNADGSLLFYDRVVNGRIYKFNILNELAETGNKNDNRTFNTNLQVNYDILPGLRLESNFGAISSSVFGESYASEYAYYIATLRLYEFGQYGIGDNEYQSSPLPHGGEYNSTEARTTSLMWRNSLAYNTLKNKHRFGAMLGQEMRSVKTDGFSSIQYGYFPSRGKNITLPPRTITTHQGVTSNYIYNSMKSSIVDRSANFLSYYGTGTYSYDERFVVTGSLRSDASNRFGQDKRHRFLPVWATGLRWNAHNEPWLANQTWLSELNVRASYGWQGNVAENFGPDLIAQLPSDVVNYRTGEYELKIKSLAYADLRWEKTKTINLGLDLGIAANRFILSIEYYTKKTTDMIIYKPVASSYGIDAMPINGGDMFNKGIELMLSGTVVRNKNFVWNMSLNTSKNTNRLVSDVIRNESWLMAATGQLNKADLPVSSFWVFDLKGLDPATGYPVFDIPSKGSIPNIENDATLYMKYAGKLDPDFTAGLSNSFRLKSFTLSSSFNLALGGKRLLYKMFDGAKLPSAFYNLPQEFANRWKKPGDELHTNIPSIPSLIYNPVNNMEEDPYVFMPNVQGYEYVYDMYNYSSARVVNGSFLRCNDISLSYNFSLKQTSKLGAKNLSVTGGIRNPFLIVSKDFKGMDPEVATGNQPMPRVYTLGINMSF